MHFSNNFELNILDDKEYELVFELIGCDASFANALRRILLAEVPTVAIETIFMWNNTSIIHDEVLSHRLGLIPLDVDARLFDAMDDTEEAEPSDRNTVVFQLRVSCGSGPSTSAAASKTNTSDDDDDNNDGESSGVGVVVENPDLDRVALAAAKKDAIETPGRPYTKHIYSKDLVWLPQGSQQSRFPNGIRPVHDDILIAKLRPGQIIDLEAHARVGIGKDHAKFSPVATACYRLHTEITIDEPIFDDDAEQLVNLYEPGVFELVKSSVPGKNVEAKVCNPYACTMSRNYMRNPTLAKSITMKRIPNHYIFSIESVGMQRPGVLVAEALRVLQQKCTNLLHHTRAQADY